jgi:hypothetical protein
MAMASFWRTFIMRVKSAQAGEVRGARPLPISTITYKVVMHAPAERADAHLLYLLYPYMCSVSISAITQSEYIYNGFFI